MQPIRECQHIFPKSSCDELIRFYEEHGPETSNGISINNTKLDALQLSKELENKVKPLIEICADAYRLENTICDEPLTYRASRIVKYVEGSECSLHYDSELLEIEPDVFKPRPLNIITFLNDGFEGGFLVFPFQDKLFIPGVGTAVLFPTSFPYKHLVTKVVGEPRYVMVSSIIRNKIKLY